MLLEEMAAGVEFVVVAVAVEVVPAQSEDVEVVVVWPVKKEAALHGCPVAVRSVDAAVAD